MQSNNTPTVSATPAPTPSPQSENLETQLNSINLGDEDAAIKEVDTQMQSL